MRLYIGFLLFFVTINNGMSCQKKIRCLSYCKKLLLRTKWSVDENNQGIFSLCQLGSTQALGELRTTLLSLDNTLIEEIRIDEVKGNLSSDELTYLLHKFIKQARKKQCKVIGYHDFLNAHSSLHFALIVNDFTKTLIRSKLGNKNISDMSAEHYFYEKEL